MQWQHQDSWNRQRNRVLLWGTVAATIITVISLQEGAHPLQTLMFSIGAGTIASICGAIWYDL